MNFDLDIRQLVHLHTICVQFEGQVKVIGHSSGLQEETVAEVVGATCKLEFASE